MVCGRNCNTAAKDESVWKWLDNVVPGAPPQTPNEGQQPNDETAVAGESLDRLRCDGSTA